MDKAQCLLEGQEVLAGVFFKILEVVDLVDTRSFPQVVRGMEAHEYTNLYVDIHNAANNCHRMIAKYVSLTTGFAYFPDGKTPERVALTIINFFTTSERDQNSCTIPSFTDILGSISKKIEWHVYEYSRNAVGMDNYEARVKIHALAIDAFVYTVWSALYQSHHYIVTTTQATHNKHTELGMYLSDVNVKSMLSEVDSGVEAYLRDYGQYRKFLIESYF